MKLTSKETFELPENSFYLISYPRSGNTWLLNSLVMLFGAIRSEACSSLALWPHLYGEVNDKNFYLRAETPLDMKRPLIIKSHTTFDTYEAIYPKKMYIYLSRWSRCNAQFLFLYARFSSMKDINLDKGGIQQIWLGKTSKSVNFDPKEFADFLNDHTLEWVNHVNTWLEAKDVFFLSYESMHHGFEKNYQRSSSIWK
ncbi:MAG: sulfotransferase domain-containing protein [Thioploca sp.]|nr:sulfotransferase domain-containing protein [Thioploca sp.]